jgi:hypothetical protein
MYSSQHNGKADPDGLFILEGGGNDILDTTTGTPEDLELLLRQAHDSSVRAYLSGFEVELKRFETNQDRHLHLRTAKVRRQTVDDHRTLTRRFQAFTKSMKKLSRNHIQTIASFSPNKSA